MNPSTPPNFLILVILDTLHAAGVISEDGVTQGRNYLKSIPGYIKATVDDYEKWKTQEGIT